MKLFVFRPNGHGAETFAVMEDNEDAAKIKVLKAIQEDNYMCTSVESFLSEDYSTEIYEQGQVAVNDND